MPEITTPNNIVLYHAADGQRCLQFESTMQSSLFSFAHIVRSHLHHKSDGAVCAIILVIPTTSRLTH